MMFKHIIIYLEDNLNKGKDSGGYKKRNQLKHYKYYKEWERHRLFMICKGSNSQMVYEVSNIIKKFLFAYVFSNVNKLFFHILPCSLTKTDLFEKMLLTGLETLISIFCITFIILFAALYSTSYNRFIVDYN